MIKVDLAKEIEQVNRPEEALLQEAKTLLLEADTGHLQMLRAAGLDHQVREAMRDNERISAKLKLRIMHGVPVMTESDIKNLCVKYRLKFLSSRLYRGVVPNEVGTTIFNFMKRIGSPNPEHSARSMYILAPAEAFDLVSYKTRTVPKDPLLFYKIEDSSLSEPMYALVTKWGNDFTVFRRVAGFFMANPERYAHIMRFVWFSVIFAAIMLFASQITNISVGFTVFISILSFVLAWVGRGIVRDHWQDSGAARSTGHQQIFTEHGWNVDTVHKHNKFFI